MKKCWGRAEDDGHTPDLAAEETESALTTRGVGGVVEGGKCVRHCAIRDRLKEERVRATLRRI